VHSESFFAMLDDRLRVVVNELCYIDIVRRANPGVSWTDPPRACLQICCGLMLRHALQRSSPPSNRWAGRRRRQRRHSRLLIQMLQRSEIHDRPQFVHFPTKH